MGQINTTGNIPSPLHGKEKWKNWWYYHWKLVAGFGAVFLWVAWLLLSVFTQVKPDYQIAVVSAYTLSGEQTKQITDFLETLADDRNGDGVVEVRLNDIQLDYRTQSMDAAVIQAMESNIDKLHADLYNCQSCLFLLDDPEAFQANAGALSYLDGSVPPEGATDWENMVVPVNEIPALRDVVGENMQSFYLGRRAAFTAQDEKALQGVEHFWTALLEGMPDV